jgi:hypothetical protein
MTRRDLPRRDLSQRRLLCAATVERVTSTSRLFCRFTPTSGTSSAVSTTIRFLEHRIGDNRIIRLIRKRLKMGILEDGVMTIYLCISGLPLTLDEFCQYSHIFWINRNLGL